MIFHFPDFTGLEHWFFPCKYIKNDAKKKTDKVEKKITLAGKQRKNRELPLKCSEFYISCFNKLSNQDYEWNEWAWRWLFSLNK